MKRSPPYEVLSFRAPRSIKRHIDRAVKLENERADKLRELHINRSDFILRAVLEALK